MYTVEFSRRNTSMATSVLKLYFPSAEYGLSKLYLSEPLPS